MTGLIVALDLPSVELARGMAERLSDTVDGFKVGLELLTGVGPRAIESIAGLGKPVFADAKLHDIPNTVERAASNLADAGARWVTVHASGGEEMLEAGVSGMGRRGVLGVTMLTSLRESDLPSIGVASAAHDWVSSLAALAGRAGAEGVVCSPAEIAAAAGEGLLVFCPGVRPEGSGRDDQRRVATPEGAAAAGADYIVVGRPVTRAEDPVLVASEITASISR